MAEPAIDTLLRVTRSELGRLRESGRGRDHIHPQLTGLEHGASAAMGGGIGGRPRWPSGVGGALAVLMG